MPAIEEPPITVACLAEPDGWRCDVRVGDDEAATDHAVMLDHKALRDLAPVGASPEELVLESFRFLLEREPRDAIMRRFELLVISRFYADYVEAIRHRLG
ncbi:MAG: hypothetical protein M3O77_05805 [Chloroflexota bacterium]|nr:hypothetical protein [Chloroflexota bacterium]